MLAVLALGFDEVAGVEPLRIVHQGGHDAAAQTLTIAHDGVESLAAQVVYQEYAEENALQLVKKGVYLAEQGGALAGVAYHGANHVVMAGLHLSEGHGIALVALAGHFRGSYQLVGDAAEGTHHHYYGLVGGCLLYNLFQIKNTLYGTYGCSAKFHYFHLY